MDSRTDFGKTADQVSAQIDTGRFERTAQVKERADQAMTLAEMIEAGERPSLPFTLQHTMKNPVEVRVQRPSLFYLMSQGLLPRNLRDLAEDQIKKFGPKGAAAALENLQADEAALQELVDKHGLASLATLEADLYDATALAGFVSPSLVAKPEDARPRENILWVGRIAYEDRKAFFNWCNKEAAEDAAAAKSTSGPVPLRDDAGDVPAREDVRGAAESDVSSLVGPTRSDAV